jgi:hypothetical protein
LDECVQCLLFSKWSLEWNGNLWTQHSYQTHCSWSLSESWWLSSSIIGMFNSSSSQSSQKEVSGGTDITSRRKCFWVSGRLHPDEVNWHIIWRNGPSYLFSLLRRSSVNKLSTNMLRLKIVKYVTGTTDRENRLPIRLQFLSIDSEMTQKSLTLERCLWFLYESSGVKTTLRPPYRRWHEPSSPNSLIAWRKSETLLEKSLIYHPMHTSCS